MPMRLALAAILLLAIPSELEWSRSNWKKYVSSEKGVEVRLWDGTRVDYLGKTYAFEIDFADKWAEAIGQSLYYSTVTGKRPAVILLVKDMEKERRYVYRCQTVCAKYGIRLFVERVEE